MRKTTIKRETTESQIQISLNLDGDGSANIKTGIPFFDHMLSQLAFHGQFDLEITAEGDLEVDDHHTVEDVGIVFGQAFRKCLGDKRGIVRYGSCLLPMDEVLAQIALDASGRSFLRYNVKYQREKIGTLSTENTLEFFRAVVRESQITLHIDVLEAGNDHHQAEAIFKGFARALRQAVRLEENMSIPSTKGTL